MRRAADILVAVGIFAPAFAWYAAQQGQGALTYYRCDAAGPPLGLLVAGAGLAACLAAGLLGLRTREGSTTETGRFFARCVPGLAALFGLANLAVFVATLMIPPCAR